MPPPHFLPSGLASVYWARYRAEPDGLRRSFITWDWRWVAGRPQPFADRLMMPVSNDTLLRVVRRRTEQPRDKLAIIGIDDFAFRRGQRYARLSAILSAAGQ